MADNWLERLFSYEEFQKYLDLQLGYFQALIGECLNNGDELTRGKIKGIKEAWFFPIEKIANEETRKHLKQTMRKKLAKIEIEAAIEE